MPEQEEPEVADPHPKQAKRPEPNPPEIRKLEEEASKVNKARAHEIARGRSASPSSALRVSREKNLLLQRSFFACSVSFFACSAGLVCLLAATAPLILSTDAPPPRTDVAEGRYGPLLAAGDAAVLSARGVLRLCKEEKRCAAAREQLSHLTPVQRRKLGSGVWLFASLALPSTPLTVLGRAPARVLARPVTVLRSAVFASKPPPAAATFATAAMGGAAKAGARTARAAAAATATATKAGVKTLPASLQGSPAAAKTYYLALELTRRSGAKHLLLDVPLPSAVNPVTRRVLASFPGARILTY